MTQEQHGGKRKGSGRPIGSGKYGSPTKVVRIPEEMVSRVHQLIQQKEFKIPLYGSHVKAGFPSPADDHVESYLDLNNYLIKHPETTFYARVAGDSMRGAGIHPNDLLVVDRGLEPSNGKIVVVVINGEMTVKRLRKTAEGCWLIAENPHYPPIPLKEQDEIFIWGVVTSVIKQV